MCLVKASDTGSFLRCLEYEDLPDDTHHSDQHPAGNTSYPGQEAIADNVPFDPKSSQARI